MEHPLRSYRKLHGLSLDGLAQRIGSTASTLSRIESGRVAPSLDLLRRIKGETGISADLLIEALPNETSGSAAADPSETEVAS